MLVPHALAVLTAAAPVVSVEAPDAGGCARGVLVDGRRVSGGPLDLAAHVAGQGESHGGGPRRPAPTFCLREAVGLRLEGVPHVALRVDAPHRFDGRVRSRVFVYRVEGRRLVPRFLGSGFTSREVTGLSALDDGRSLGVRTATAAGARATLRCVFDGFPLVCSEVTP